MSSGGASFPVLDGSDLDRVTGLLQANEFFWLDVHDPKPDQLSQLGELLHLHPLTIEDVSTFSERPKREHYEGYVSLVMYGVDEQAASGEHLVSPTNASLEYTVPAVTANIASGRPPSAAVSDVCTRNRST